MGRAIFLCFFLLASWPTLALREAKTLFVERNKNPTEKWTNQGKTESASIQIILDLIASSSAGKDLVKAAQKKSQELGRKHLHDSIEAGESSLTDTSLVRKFSPQAPDKLEFEERSKIYLNRNLTLLEAALDLTHELTHFVKRPVFNPYGDKFNFKDFLVETIEGEGGEVDAFISECQIAEDLFPAHFKNLSRCQLVMKRSPAEHRKVGAQQFYQIGAHWESFFEELKKVALTPKNLPQIGREQGYFFSSAYSLPYPVAAWREYQKIMQNICRNEQNRLSYFPQAKALRIPASESYQNLIQKAQELRTNFDKRCQDFLK